MAVHLSDHFTYKKIFKIVIFPIIMMVFTSLYSIVDGVFISNFSTKASFAAVNLVFPIIFIVGSIGFIFGTGGSALVAKYLGEKRNEKANQTFSLIVYATLVVGSVFSIVFSFLIEPICLALGRISESSSPEMIEKAIIYGRILALGQVIFMLQNLFQSFFMVAEKSRLGFRFVLFGGLTNMALDALLIGVFKLGVVGAAIATISGYVVAGIGPLIYFSIKKDGVIYLGKCPIVMRDIFQSLYNGMSEFVSNISMSIVSIVYNSKLLEIYGEVGVSAYGVVMYVSFVFIAVFIGYSIGVAPVVSYNYGAKNKEELTNIVRKSFTIIIGLSIVMALSCLISARGFSSIFANGDQTLLNLASTAMRISSIVFLVCGYSIFASCFFTALNNGTISALISFLRTIVLEIGFVLILPLFMGGNGVWWAIVFGEVLSTISAFIFLITHRKRYGYSLLAFKRE